MVLFTSSDLPFTQFFSVLLIGRSVSDQGCRLAVWLDRPVAGDRGESRSGSQSEYASATVLRVSLLMLSIAVAAVMLPRCLVDVLPGQSFIATFQGHHQSQSHGGGVLPRWPVTSRARSGDQPEHAVVGADPAGTDRQLPEHHRCPCAVDGCLGFILLGVDRLYAGLPTSPENAAIYRRNGGIGNDLSVQSTRLQYSLLLR